MVLKLAVNKVWKRFAKRSATQFVRALQEPQLTQDLLLTNLVEQNVGTRFGREHGFSDIKDYDDFQDKVPIRRYEDFLPWIDRIRAGSLAELTKDAVTRLQPSSGSVGPVKWIPMNKSLLRSFQEAVSAWIFDLYQQQPLVMDGSAYWSLSPQMKIPETQSAIPLGFEDDSAYGGRWLQPLIRTLWPVPKEVQFADDLEAFQELTLLYLLQAQDLRLISIWHPSFMKLLLDMMMARWDSLVRGLYDGKRFICGDRQLEIRNRKVARRLLKLDPANTQSVWPKLLHISCWADGHAHTAAADLQRIFPEAVLAPKSLLATEGCVSVPFNGAWPLAIRSTFLEFEDPEGVILRAHQLSQAGTYKVIMTTPGGLYRYRLDDQITVTGWAGATPSVRFTGKSDFVSDLVGEKLNEAFVACTLKNLKLGGSLLVPVRDPAHYRLLLHSNDIDETGQLAARLDGLLRENPYYAQARDLGQLKAIEVETINYDPQKKQLMQAATDGRVMGSVKLLALAKAVDR